MTQSASNWTNRTEQPYHHTYMEERYVMDCIREGNVEEINERASGLFEKAGILSKKRF